jgi:hypothetical protein
MDEGSDAVLLQSRLQPENPRKIKTHRTLDKRNMEPNVRFAAPSRAKQTIPRKRKFKASVASGPVCGSAPRTRTKKTGITLRKDKKNPMENAKETAGVRRLPSVRVSLVGLILSSKQLSYSRVPVIQ